MRSLNYCRGHCSLDQRIHAAFVGAGITIPGDPAADWNERLDADMVMSDLSTLLGLGSARAMSGFRHLLNDEMCGLPLALICVERLSA